MKMHKQATNLKMSVGLVALLCCILASVHPAKSFFLKPNDNSQQQPPYLLELAKNEPQQSTANADVDSALESHSMQGNFFALTDVDPIMLNAFIESEIRSSELTSGVVPHSPPNPISANTRKPYTVAPVKPNLQSATDVQGPLAEKQLGNQAQQPSINSNTPVGIDQAGFEREKVNSNRLPTQTAPPQVPPSVDQSSDELVKSTFHVITKNFIRNKIVANNILEKQSQIDQQQQSGCLERAKESLAQGSSTTRKPASSFEEAPDRLIVDDAIIEDLKFTSSKLTNSSKAKSRQKIVVSANPDPRCANLENFSTFEHPKACDKYFQCESGAYVERVCPNGLMYGTRNIVRDSCVHRWHADCGEKSIPNPVSSPGCRWQNGIFNVEDSPRCSPDYYECIDGRFHVRRCDVDGHMYDERTKSCRWGEGMGCVSDILGFTCPPNDKENMYYPFPRYFLNNFSFITCINDKPQVFRCGDGERVHVQELYCVSKS